MPHKERSKVSQKKNLYYHTKKDSIHAAAGWAQSSEQWVGETN